MIPLGPVVLVEGKYDQNKILQIFDATVLTTGGFQIFKNEEQVRLLRRLAETRGLLILTDSDGAGFVIRNKLRGALTGGRVYQAYIPDLPGKEKRKRAPSKEGKLGVEGVPDEVIIAAVRRSGALDETPAPRAAITKADLYALGLSGGPESAAKRRRLCRLYGLPEHLSANALLEVLRCVTDRAELAAAAQKLEEPAHQEER